MEKWMRSLGLVMNLKDLGVTEDMIEEITGVTITLRGGYHVPDRDEIVEIFRESL